MSSTSARSLLSKLRRDIPRSLDLARDWRETRRRDGMTTLQGTAATGRVVAQQAETTITSSVQRGVRIARGGRIKKIFGEVVRRGTGRSPGAATDEAPKLGERPTRAVLISYACKPDAGSEEGVGWTWTKAAAEVVDVIVFTNPFAVDEIRKASADLGLAIEVAPVEPWRPLRAIATRRFGGFVYYVLWQAAARRALRRLERSQPIDVVHHVTWASDSLPSPLRASKAPIRIWGPVGGSTRMAPSHFRFLSPKARIDEIIRDVSNFSFRLVGGHPAARHATKVVALNPDVHRRFASGRTPVVIEPNCALSDDELSVTPTDHTPIVDPDDTYRTALFVARVIGWKGPLLAVRSLVHAPSWRLVVLGEGSEREHAEALAKELGVADRVDFRGLVPRPDVLAAFVAADALLFPSFHDSAPWAVGEAASLGCPVVCLDAGGPALLAGRNAHVVKTAPGRDLPQRLGARLEGLQGRGTPEDAWRADRLPGLLASWYGLEEDRT